ncbi:hypothetical protein T484DRAFT_1923901, partial [Baffinella frigidus]
HPTSIKTPSPSHPTSIKTPSPSHSTSINTRAPSRACIPHSTSRLGVSFNGQPDIHTCTSWFVRARGGGAVRQWGKGEYTVCQV